MDLRCGHFSVKMYAKMKELGPIGGRAPGMPPRSANDVDTRKLLTVCVYILQVLYYVSKKVSKNLHIFHILLARVTGQHNYLS